ncbi:MAG TPA: hypothetical protein VL200_07910 [Lacunisphaera sp.]|jgi:hypothetical protein|nr:hypothetical protein [Lacunisphaera sp.]
MFERRHDKLVPFPRFVRRVVLSMLLTLAVLLVALGIGVIGYHEVAGLRWIDALLNASMILTGMGPVDSMTTTAAKIFASCYALFSGVVFLSSIGFVLAPVFHRILHKFHLDEPSPDETHEQKET